MTAEQESVTPPARGVLGLRMLVALLLLAFVGGALIMAWVARDWAGWQWRREALNVVAPDDLANDAEENAATNNAAAPAPPVDEQLTKAAELEQRLARISVAAQAASANANRAEAMLTAFAARRALDAGRPLGYIEQTLRLRFGEAQPRAVATIINAAAEPVTLADLRAGLSDIVLEQKTSSFPSGWWSSFWREIRGLAVIRRASDPSPDPVQRIARARRAVELGQMDDAIAEMSALPQQPAVLRWLEKARRYNEAHRALDLVEAAAILEPRAAPSAQLPDSAAPAPAANAVAGNEAAPTP